MITVIFLFPGITCFKFDIASVFTKSLSTFSTVCLAQGPFRACFCDYILKEEEKGEERVEENRGRGRKMKMTEKQKAYNLQL